MIISKTRFPRPYQQNIYVNGKLNTTVGSCVACSFTRIIEVLNYIATGTYTNMSVGYLYGRHNKPDKKNGGMDEVYTLNSLMNKGTVPENMCDVYGEMPDIKLLVDSLPNISELDRIALATRISGWKELKFSELCECLERYDIPVAGKTKKNGDNHSVVVVGYENNYVLYLDHDGTDTIHKSRSKNFSKFYFIEGLEKESKMEKVDDIQDIVRELNKVGVITDTNLWNKKCKEDINVYWLCYKVANKLRGAL